MKPNIIPEIETCIYENDNILHFIYTDGREILFNRHSLQWGLLGAAAPEDIDKIYSNHEIKFDNHLCYRLEQSTKCNLNCQYCCVKRNNIYEDLGESNKIMSIDLAKAILDQFYNEATQIKQEKKIVYFYGEEPFEGWETLKAILSDTRFFFYVNTNGLLLNDEKLETLSKPHVYTIFSLDGMPQHNILRFKNTEMYNKLIDNYKKLRELGGHGGFSITIHKYNEDDLVNIIKEFMRQYNPDGIGLGLPMYYSTGAVDAAKINIPNLVKTLKELFILSLDNKIFLPYLASKVRPLVNGIFRMFWCEAIGNTRTFLPSGKEILCSRLSAKMNVNKDLLKSWAPINNPYCSKCAAIGICGGGCPWSANMMYKNHIDERECFINKQMLPFILGILSTIATSSFDDKLESSLNGVISMKEPY